MVKIIGVSGSPRKNSSTTYSVKEALSAAKGIGDVETELIILQGLEIKPCIHCDKCLREESLICVLWKDGVTNVLKKLHEADGIILGSPVYGMGITPQMSAFLSRYRGTYYKLLKEPDYFVRQVGGAIAVGGTRNGGQENVVNQLYGFFSTHGITPANGALCVYSGACVWNALYSPGEEGAKQDEEGMKHCRRIGEKVAKLAKALKDNPAFD
ncbi:MAG: flavodoxin family protein [Bacillota bacterium]